MSEPTSEGKAQARGVLARLLAVFSDVRGGESRTVLLMSLNIFMVLVGGCVMVLIDDIDYLTAMSAVICTVMNIGPGFGGIGPSKNYGFISKPGKWFLSYNMLVGRLEVFSALVIFYPSFWRR